MVLPIRDVPGAPAQAAWRLRPRATARCRSTAGDLASAHLGRGDDGARGPRVVRGAAVTKPLARPSCRAVRPGRQRARPVECRPHRSGWSLVDAGPTPRARRRQRYGLGPTNGIAPAGARWTWLHRATTPGSGLRAEALPDSWPVPRAGSCGLQADRPGGGWRRGASGCTVRGRPWRREAPAVDLLAGRSISWRRLTHTAAAAGILPRSAHTPSTKACQTIYPRVLFLDERHLVSTALARWRCSVRAGTAAARGAHGARCRRSLVPIPGPECGWITRIGGRT
jgi:hypothetical protein